VLTDDDTKRLDWTMSRVDAWSEIDRAVLKGIMSGHKLSDVSKATFAVAARFGGHGLAKSSVHKRYRTDTARMAAEWTGAREPIDRDTRECWLNQPTKESKSPGGRGERFGVVLCSVGDTRHSRPPAPPAGISLGNRHHAYPHAAALRPPRQPVDRPDIAKQAAPLYSTPEYAEWRAAVVTRDGGRCVDPNCRGPHYPGQRVYADHIVEVKDGGAAFDISNGITRCASSHTFKTNRERAKRQRGEKG